MPVSMNSNKSMGITFRVILFVIVLLVLAWALLFSPKGDSEESTNEQYATVAAVEYNNGAVVSFGEEATFLFVGGEEPWKDSLRFERIYDLEEEPFYDSVVAVYEIGFTSDRQPAQPVRFALSCRDLAAEDSVGASNGFCFFSYNEETGLWEELPTMYDYDAQVLVCYLHHFSSYRAEASESPKTAPSATPMLTTGPIDSRVLESIRTGQFARANSILAASSSLQDPGIVRDAVLDGINYFNEAFGSVAITTSALENMLSVSGVQRFNSIAGEIGLLGALGRYVIETNDPSITERESKLRLYQDLANYFLGKYAWQGVQIAGVGIFIINYSMNEFATAAFSNYEEYWWRQYRIFNTTNNPHPNTKEEWADFIFQTVISSEVTAAQVVENALAQKTEEYLNAFFLAECPIYEQHWLYSRRTPQHIREVLINREKQQLLAMLEQAKIISEAKVQHYREDAFMQQMQLAADMFNETRQIRVYVYGDSVGDPRIRNLPVRVPVRENQNLWQGVTGDDGCWYMNLTLYGYLRCGTPRTVELEYDGQVLTRTIVSNAMGNFDIIRFYLDDPGPQAGVLQVASEPSGAHIFLDGVEIGLTPGEFDAMAEGTYEIAVRLENYKEYNITADIALGDTTSVQALLELEAGTLIVTSEPSGAHIFLDGVEIGLTPGEFDAMAEGTYEIAVRLEDYRDYTTTADIALGDTTSILASLEDEASTLVVTSEPVGASISIDGNPTGRTTDVELVEIEPGPHQVIITLEGYEDFVATVTIEENETTNLNAELEESDRKTWPGNGHSYEAVLRPGGVSWDAARSEASGMGGYLATISSPGENDFVFSLVSDDLAFWVVDEAENSQGPFLGGFQESSSSTSEGWRWVTGEEWSFNNWSPGEPNDAGETLGAEDSEEGHLQFFHLGNAGGEPIPGSAWNDVCNDDVRGFVVEWDSVTSD